MRNFEHNVQQKASAFQIDPESDSFDKVMAALEKRKKRRLIIWIWWLIPGLAISTGIILTASFNGSIAKQSNQSLSSKHSSAFDITVHDHYDIPDNSISGETNTSHDKNGMNQPIIQEIKTNSTNILTTTKQPVIHTILNKKDTTLLDKEPRMLANTHSTESVKDEDENVELLYTRRNLSAPIMILSPTFERISFMKSNIPGTGFINLNPRQQVLKKEFSRFSLGAYTDLGVMKSLFFENNYPTSADYTNSRKNTDVFLFSYSAGLQFRYSPFKFLSFETGIGYTHFRSTQLIANSVGTWTTSSQPDPDTVLTGALAAPSVDTKEFNNVYGYISIPLKVYYQKQWNWFGMEAGAGVIFDIPVNTYSYVADENNDLSYLRTNVNEARLNKFGLQLSTNIHAVFHIKKLSLFAGPTFRYRANSMFDDQYIVKQHYYFIGGETGVRYNF